MIPNRPILDAWSAPHIHLCMGRAKSRKRRIGCGTTTLDTLFFYSSGSGASTVYTLSGPMLYTLCPGFPKDIVYTIAADQGNTIDHLLFWLCDQAPRGQGQTKRGGVPR